MPEDNNLKNDGMIIEIDETDDYDDIDDLDDDIDIVPVIPEEPVIIFGKEINAVLFEMITGIITFGLLCQITIVWFVNPKPGFSIALWIGIAVAIGYSLHMWWSIERYLYMGVHAVSYARKYMALRYMAVAIVLALAALTNVVQLLAVFLGIMGIKAGALMQPLLRKVIKRGSVNG